MRWFHDRAHTAAWRGGGHPRWPVVRHAAGGCHAGACRSADAQRTGPLAVGREAEAYKAGCKHGREDVMSIMPLLVAAQARPADGSAPPRTTLRTAAEQ